MRSNSSKKAFLKPFKFHEQFNTDFQSTGVGQKRSDFFIFGSFHKM